MFELVDGTSRIEVKLTTSGRYIWTISSTFPTQDGEGGIKRLRQLDGLMKREFPDHAVRGSGRIASFDEDGKE